MPTTTRNNSYPLQSTKSALKSKTRICNTCCISVRYNRNRNRNDIRRNGLFRPRDSGGTFLVSANPDNNLHLQTVLGPERAVLLRDDNGHQPIWRPGEAVRGLHDPRHVADDQQGHQPEAQQCQMSRLLPSAQEGLLQEVLVRAVSLWKPSKSFLGGSSQLGNCCQNYLE